MCGLRNGWGSAIASHRYRQTVRHSWNLGIGCIREAHSFPPMSSESQTDTHGIFGMVGETLYLPTKSSDNQETLMESLEWLGKRDSFPQSSDSSSQRHSWNLRNQLYQGSATASHRVLRQSSQRHSWNLRNRLYQGSAISSHRCPQTVRDTHGIFGISCIREARQLPTDILRQSSQRHSWNLRNQLYQGSATASH